MLIPGRALQWILVNGSPVARPSRMQLPGPPLWHPLMPCGSLNVFIISMFSYSDSPLPQTIQSWTVRPFPGFAGARPSPYMTTDM